MNVWKLVCKSWRMVAKQSYVRAQCTAASHGVAQLHSTDTGAEWTLGSRHLYH